jgi:hypothetical protein
MSTASLASPRRSGPRMTTVVFTRRFLADYARNPANLFLLVVVPVVFVALAAGRLADLATLFGAATGASLSSSTAGWAAGFLTGIVMYFQVAAARDVDRRLVLAGLPVHRLVTARLAAGLGLALVASAAALLTLQVRAGIDNPLRVLAGTLMFALIYLGIGATLAYWCAARSTAACWCC